MYISIRGRKNGDHFHWDSGLMREQVLGDPQRLNVYLFQALTVILMEN